MSVSSALRACLAALCAAGCTAAHWPEPVQPLVPTSDAAFRASPPPQSAPNSEPPVALPIVESATLGNGLAVWAVHRPELPYVALSVVARDAGTLVGRAPAERVRLTARAAVEAGTVWFDNRVVEPPRINGEQVRSRSYATHSRFDLRVLKRSLLHGVSILGRTVQAPAFGRGHFEDAQVAELQYMQDTSASLNGTLFELTLRAALGQEVASRLLGTNMEETRRATPALVEHCYEELFRPESSALIAVGDLTLAELVPLAEREFGSWESRGARPSLSTSPPVWLSSHGVRLHFLPQADTAQAHVVLLQPAPTTRAVGDELPFQLLVDIAVGAITSRGNLSLRHHAGITYGIEPSVESGPELGVLRIEAAFETDETVRAIRDLQQILGELQRKQVTDAELALAKVARSAEFERDSQNNQVLARELGSAFARGKSADWLASKPKALNAVSAADIQRVAQTYLRPFDLEVGIAGPPELALELRGFGELVLYQLTRSERPTESE